MYYSDVIMSGMVSQIAGVSIVYSTVCSDADQRKHQSSASLASVRGIHRWSLKSAHKGSVTRKSFHLMTSPWCRKNSREVLDPCMSMPRLQQQSVIFGSLYSTAHDDVIKWKHFPRNWPFVQGIHRSRWIPHTTVSDAELWCFLWSASE